MVLIADLLVIHNQIKSEAMLLQVGALENKPDPINDLLSIFRSFVRAN